MTKYEGASQSCGPKLGNECLCFCKIFVLGRIWFAARSLHVSVSASYLNVANERRLESFLKFYELFMSGSKRRFVKSSLF